MTNEFVYEDWKSVTKLNEATHFLSELRNGRDLRTDSHSSMNLILHLRMKPILNKTTRSSGRIGIYFEFMIHYELLLLLITLLNSQHTKSFQIGDLNLIAFFALNSMLIFVFLYWVLDISKFVCKL